MNRYLLITPLDVLRQTNNREHHLLAHVAPRFAETCVVFRRRCERRGVRTLLWDALVPRLRVVRSLGARLVEVNPLLNHFQGLAMDLAGTYEMPELGAPAQNRRQRVLRWISSFGILKDLSTIAFLTLAALARSRGRFDVCTAMGPYAAAAAVLLKKLGKVKLLVYEDRDYEAAFVQTPLRNRFAAWLESACLERADLRIATGYRMARLRRAQTGLPMEVVTGGVDAGRFRAPSRERACPVLVYTGNLTYWSGLDVVLAAMPLIRAVLPGVKLRVIGEAVSGYRAQLEALVAQLDLADCVEFLGRVENRAMPELLAAAHLGIAVFRPIALRQYASPLKVFEYMAAGLPSIGARGTETEDILARHECGLSVEHEPAAFAAAALHMLTDAALYRRMATKARAAAEAHYDWPRLMEREYGLMARGPWS